MKNVYLIPINNGDYMSSISEIRPFPHAIFLMEEPSYPATVLYPQLDINTDILWRRCDVANPEELMDLLDFMGENGLYISSVCYDFDSQNPTEYYDLSQNTNMELECLYDMRYAKMCAWMDEIIDAIIEDYENNCDDE